MKRLAILIVAGLALITGPATAAVYKCIADDGSVTFSQIPCATDAKKLDVEPSYDSDGAPGLRPGVKRMVEAFERERAEDIRENLEARRKHHKKLLRKIAIEDAIDESAIVIGMTKEQVIQSWGEPNEINESLYADGKHEQWVYVRGDYEAQYVYFTNGRVTGVN